MKNVIVRRILISVCITQQNITLQECRALNTETLYFISFEPGIWFYRICNCYCYSADGPFQPHVMTGLTGNLKRLDVNADLLNFENKTESSQKLCQKDLQEKWSNCLCLNPYGKKTQLNWPMLPLYLKKKNFKNIILVFIN